MSVQFGTCNLDGKPADRSSLEAVRPLLPPCERDGEAFFCNGGAIVLYRAPAATKESLHGAQPYVSASGMIVTWAGRLDNREDLIRDLGGALSCVSSDLSIAASAYVQWKTKALPKLIGDWTLSVWNPRDGSLILAKDFSGTRQLFYRIDKQQVAWCTLLDPLLRLAKHSFELEEEYIAGWLSQFPRCDLTPYVGIRSVPPASFVRIDRNGEKTTKFWDFNPVYCVRYKNDGEYEEHFRVLFLESVRRRLRADSPILAELSGGMDSSSIVCAADAMIKQGRIDVAGLETVSYFDDSEPNWNEKPYFSIVEKTLGRKGNHIDVGRQSPLHFDLDIDRLLTTPASAEFSEAVHDQFQAALVSSGSRVLLTGTGGDEITGGVPTPLPELQDLLARAHLRRLARQLKLWALNKRRPWFHLLVEAAAGFLPCALTRQPEYLRPAPWIEEQFAKRHQAAFEGYDGRLKFLSALPSFQQNVQAFEQLRRQLGCDALSPFRSYEKRYPYLDRDLVEFMYAVPREQVVRPGQRRSLMRRALAGIVPPEVLERKRKAYVTHAAIAGISSEYQSVQQRFQRSVSGTLGFINETSFLAALDGLRHGQDISIVAVARTLLLEIWLRNLEGRGILAVATNRACALESTHVPKISAEEIQTEGGEKNEIREAGDYPARVRP